MANSAQKNRRLDRFDRCFPKFYIRDLLSATLAEVHGNYSKRVFLYKNNSISTVDVMGMITKVDERQKVIIYTVDDGTGVIQCTVFKNVCECNALRQIAAHIPEGPLMSKFEKVLKEKERLSERFEHGELLHVKGILQLYRNTRCIKVYKCEIVRDFMAEVRRMALLVELHREIYDKPSVFPRIKPNKPKSDAFSPDATRKLILDMIYKQQLVSFTHQDMLESLEQVSKKVAKYPVDFRKALEGLERTGHIYTSSTSGPRYLVSQYCKHLRKGILEALATNSKVLNGINLGCSIYETFNKIRQIRRFWKLNVYSVWICTRQLERQSDIVFYETDRFVLVT